MKYKAPKKIRRKNKVIEDYWDECRMALGLPIRNKHARPYWGYERDSRESTRLKPIEKHLRALRKAYDLMDEGNTIADVAAWLSENIGRKIDKHALCRMKYTRPVFKEIVLPEHERERIYRFPAIRY